MSVPAYLKYSGLTILFLLATVNFTRTTLNVIESSKRLDEAKNDVSALEIEKARLEEELEYKISTEYIEKEARNKLGLVKPGEQIFVPSEVLGAESHNDFNSRNFSELSNFNKWVELFL